MRLDKASDKTVTVDYATADGTSVAGEHYTAASGTLTFVPGETAKTVEWRCSPTPRRSAR